jgi:hypothetical protein
MLSQDGIPITLHDRIFNESNMRITNTSGWIVLKKNKYFEFLHHHEFQGDGDQGGNLWDRNIEIRAKLVSLNGHDDGIANPFIMIQGPMKEVTV